MVCGPQWPMQAICSGSGTCVFPSNQSTSDGTFSSEAEGGGTCVCFDGWTGRSDFINYDSADCLTYVPALRALWALALLAACLNLLYVLTAIGRTIYALRYPSGPRPSA